MGPLAPPPQATDAVLATLSTVLRQKVPQPGQNPITEENIFMWDQGKDMMMGLAYWMKTLTTKKLVSVTVANAETRLLANDKRESGMEFSDEEFYDCQAYALGTWIPTHMVAKGQVKEGTRQGYRIRLESLWDVLHDPALATVIYEEQNPAKANASDIKANDVIVFWKPQLRADHGRDGNHAARIVTPVIQGGKLAPDTGLSTKNGLKAAQPMTLGELGSQQPNYVKDAVMGVYRLTEATSFH